MSMAFCSQALHQGTAGGQLGEVVRLRFGGLGFRFPFFRLAGHSSSWASSLAGLLPLRVAPHFISCSGRSPASPQGQHVVVAAHLPVLFQDILDGLPGRIVAGHPQFGEPSVDWVFPPVTQVPGVPIVADCPVDHGHRVCFGVGYEGQLVFVFSGDAPRCRRLRP